jgi:hypothetical protein
MVNAYKLGNLTLKWNGVSWCVCSDSDIAVAFYSEQALLDAGATPIETESECECACHWTKGDKPFHRYGQCKCEKPESEEIEMPEYLGNVLGRQVEATNAMEKWMQQATDMLNRHEQLLREGE